jgi:hypothetical protein
MKIPFLLFLVSSAALAQGGSFDEAWRSASQRSIADDDPYIAALDAYYESDVLDLEGCDRGLVGEQSARLLLNFDKSGVFSITSESTSPSLEQCLRTQFMTNPPPTPFALPVSIPYAFKRADPASEK